MLSGFYKQPEMTFGEKLAEVNWGLIAILTVIACVGFTRNTTLCEKLTGVSEVMETNYLAPNLMYLADAEIDADAFNYFFGSSVLEYAKF